MIAMMKLKKSLTIFLGLLLFIFTLGNAEAAPGGGGGQPGAGATPIIDSAKIDRPNQRIIIAGSNLSGAVFAVGGVAIPASSVSEVSDSVQYLLFGTDLASAVARSGSYNLTVNGSKKIALYADAAILVPPPPLGGTTCPCIPGWQASGIPQDNWTWCVPVIDGTQVSLSGTRDQFFIATAFDPNNVDFNNSFCALNDGTNWTVSEAIVNWDQYDDCEQWMWTYICI